VNSALVVVALNANVPLVSQLIPQFVGLLKGEYSEMNDEWHARVGVGIVAVQLFNIAMPHLLVFIDEFVVVALKRDWVTRFAVSQAELEQELKATEFDLEDRYALALANVVIVLMFNAGYPVLNAVAAVSFGITYWVDKTLLLRVYKKPEKVGSQSAQYAAKILPIAFLLHLGLAWWSYSDEYFMPSTSLTAAAVDPSTCYGLSAGVNNATGSGESSKLAGAGAHVIGE